MTQLPGAALPLLGIAFLADVASPMSSCGCDSESDSPDAPARSRLQLIASDCGCAPDPISVTIDGQYRISVNCGTTVPYSIPLDAGMTYSIVATSPGKTWETRSVTMPEAKPVLVDLGCPK
jgi:hypothetical protein